MLDTQDFKKKNFVEKINLLTAIGEKNDIESLPRLWELYESPLGDKPVDAMVEHVICDLLNANEQETVRHISSGTLRIKKLCLQVSGRKKYKTAVPTLVELAKKEKNPGILHDVFIAMSRIKAPEFLPVFRKYVMHKDDLVSSISVRMAGEYRDESVIPVLKQIVDEAGLPENFETCTASTAQALETLAEFKTCESLEFLVENLHHKNPTVRRIIIDELVKIGSEVLPFIENIFDSDNVDDKIMAANTLSLIADKKSGEILIDALDSGKATDPNVRFAIYEAFGNIKFMKGLVCLLDALNEPDPLLLGCVIHSLEKQVNRKVTGTIKEAIDKDDDQSRRILKSIVTSEAVEIFASLYETPAIANRMVKIISLSNDEHIISLFTGKIKTLSMPYVGDHTELLLKVAKVVSKYTLLVADDSRSMLSFYRSTLAAAGFKVYTALNGQEALDILINQGIVDLVITDMNMPVMDGVVFTRKLKENPFYESIPVIMATTESDSSQQQLACSAGVAGFINKPMTADSLIEKIRDHLKNA